MRRATALLAALGLSLAFSSASMASATSRTLGTRVPELNFQSVTLGDALDYLRDVSGANISANWKALESTGVSRDTPINLHLHAVTLRKALDLLLSQAGGGDSLTYDIDQNVIEVTTRELADSKMITRVYPVEDLIMIIPDFTDAPQFSLDAASNQSGGGGGGGGGSGGTQTTLANNLLVGNGQGLSNQTPPPSKEERAKDLVDLIEQVVFTDVWKDNGGTATIRYFNGMLVVTAPRSVQEAIGGEYD